MEEKCLKCGGVLFKKVPLDEKGHMAIDENTPLDLESDGNDRFFKCPHCSAKNVVKVTINTTGIEQHEISHIKD